MAQLFDYQVNFQTFTIIFAPNPPNYVVQLRASVQHICPVSSHLTQPYSEVVDCLSIATHVFLQHDGVRKSFQPYYDGHYQVLKCRDQHFTLDIKGCCDTISVDHLKLAHINQDIPHVTPLLVISTTTPPQTTHPVDMFTSKVLLIIIVQMHGKGGFEE